MFGFHHKIKRREKPRESTAHPLWGKRFTESAPDESQRLDAPGETESGTESEDVKYENAVSPKGLPGMNRNYKENQIHVPALRGARTERRICWSRRKLVERGA